VNWSIGIAQNPTVARLIH